MLVSGGHKTRELSDLNAFSCDQQKNNAKSMEEKLNTFFKLNDTLVIPDYTTDHTFEEASQLLPFIKITTRKYGVTSELSRARHN